MVRILYAENDASMRRANIRFLKSAGHTDIVDVENGKLAHDMLVKGEKFDVLITDKDMPEMNGQALAFSPEAAGIPIRIIQSGRVESLTQDSGVWKLPKGFVGDVSSGSIILEIISGNDVSNYIDIRKTGR